MSPFRITRAAAQALPRSLTASEREIVAAFALGEPRQAIARRLFRSPVTVELHLLNVCRKWGCTAHGIGRIWFAARCGGQRDQPGTKDEEMKPHISDSVALPLDAVTES